MRLAGLLVAAAERLVDHLDELVVARLGPFGQVDRDDLDHLLVGHDRIGDRDRAVVGDELDVAGRVRLHLDHGDRVNIAATAVRVLGRAGTAG